MRRLAKVSLLLMFCCVYGAQLQAAPPAMQIRPLRLSHRTTRAISRKIPYWRSLSANPRQRSR